MRILMIIILLIIMTACSSSPDSTKIANNVVKEQNPASENTSENQKNINPEIVKEEKLIVEEAFDLLWNKALSASEEERISLLQEVKKKVYEYSDFKSEYKVDAHILYLYAEQSLLIQLYRDNMDGKGYNEMGKYDNHETYSQKFADKYKSSMVKHLMELDPTNKGEFLPPYVMSNFKDGLENFFYISDEDWRNIYNDKEQNWVEVAENEANSNSALRSIEPQIGMTQDEVIKTKWGRPNHINQTITVNGTDEQWVYDGYKYLYFEDGILTTIQK